MVAEAPQLAVKQVIVAAEKYLPYVSCVLGGHVFGMEHGGAEDVFVLPEVADVPELPEVEEPGAGPLPSGGRLRIVPCGCLPSSETCFFPRFTKTPCPTCTWPS
jgi:hypothetical protein